MDGERILAALVGGGLIEESAGRLRPTEEFRDRVEDVRRSLEPLGASRRRRELLGYLDGSDGAPLQNLTADAAALARFCVLSARTELTREERVYTIAVLDRLFEDVAADGAPESFLPVRGDRLPLLVEFTGAAIVYVWRDECPPCDAMCESFDDIFPEPPTDIALFAVYGPGWAAFLEEEYGVVGSPTTLFVFEGEVDSRLHGAPYQPVIESEIETFREVTRP